MSIFIFRRDFRIKDNTAWNHMIDNSKTIYPIFILTPEQIDNNVYKSNNSVQFMMESLMELKKEIKLTICHGDIVEVLSDIIRKNHIDKIYTNTDYTPYSVKREKRMMNFCKNNRIEFSYHHDITLFEPNSIRTSGGIIYQKFTPFYRNTIINTKRIRKPLNKSINNVNIKYAITKYNVNHKLDEYYEYNNNINVRGGRKNALKILTSIINKGLQYEKTRNILNIPTTNLSAYIKFGCVSIREVYNIFNKKLGKNNPLSRQLIWREFYYHLGHGYINRFGRSLKPQYDKIKWTNNKSHFNKWKQGKTGYPIVDACMTQLNTTGFMHNRGRLIVASFLIKNLMVDWRYGEKYFANKLVDYDVYVNQGNWQWVSGSGADSMPYFRVFNPSRQSAKYDSMAEYIKKWLPQLKNIEPKHLHEWETYYKEYNLNEINYYKPIVDYSSSKKKTLSIYRKYL